MEAAVWVVQTTLPGDWPEPIVGQWSTMLVESGLAACVQRDRVTSTFQWEGTLESSEEWRIQIKTTASSKDELIEVITSEHPYAVAQIIAWQAESTAEYTDWVEG
tara:strand:- start:6640 stop:6954 length:315 start_codon:yes stop_codon:yes gene_type:complete